MKKLLLGFCSMIILVIIAGCQKSEVTIIVPSGTPSLGVASALVDLPEDVRYQIVAGSDPLVAAMTAKTHDIVVAPINLGAKLYNSSTNLGYQLYKTIIWGNYYLVSKTQISSLQDVAHKTICLFGKNSTTDAILQSLLKYHQIAATLTYVDDVATANSYLLTGKAEIILSAEPSLTNLKEKVTLYTVDLQQAWQAMTGSYSFPQSGIFVKTAVLHNKTVQTVLQKMVDSIKQANANTELLSQNAVQIDELLAKIGANILAKAVIHCHFKILTSDIEAIEFYFNQLINLKLGATIGAKLPDEAFYI